MTGGYTSDADCSAVEFGKHKHLWQSLFCKPFVVNCARVPSLDGSLPQNLRQIVKNCDREGLLPGMLPREGPWAAGPIRSLEARSLHRGSPRSAPEARDALRGCQANLAFRTPRITRLPPPESMDDDTHASFRHGPREL